MVKSTKKWATYTTGILRRNTNTNYAIVDVVNLNRYGSRKVIVQVYDWSSGAPIALPVFPCQTKSCTAKVGPNRSAYLYADVSKVQFKYEVRITRVIDVNLINNVFGLNKLFSPQSGNTVLERNLIKLYRRK
ncbi:hypothetical protein [Paenibacillus glycanilyticus]|uniref:Uncharacterized protein n=1 Tax=Paenibacillus glycanilyticus TaxID=126569 RepID=A0ABQ6G9W3_9BACL|nr:hypothetical protein [Paenibacillus glycanilyticus]GLX66467.1 hypothetical protein MU1_08110 [Paenibacillus glycanilyticus]